MTQTLLIKMYLLVFLPYILRKWFICNYALYVTYVKYKLKVMHLQWINKKSCINHQLNAQFLYSLIIYITLCSSTCFEHRCAHLQEENCIHTVSGIVTLYKLPYSAVHWLRADCSPLSISARHCMAAYRVWRYQIL